MKKECRIYIRSTKDLENPDLFSYYFQGLSFDRQRKIDEITPAQEKRLSMAAGILLDEGLKAYGLRERKVKISVGTDGKPYLPDRPDIRFSLSHSGSLAMAVFSDHEVGCDIQQMKEIPAEEMERMSSRFFCPEEAEWMREPECQLERRIRFYRLWVLKESFLKLTGLGLKLPMDSFCFSLTPSGVKVSSKAEGKYRIQEYSFGGYRAAIIGDFT